jgi:NTP pyrophosphatase (non-canonical NTP hydrolase)
MKDQLHVLEESVTNWLKDRPTMDKANTPESLVKLLKTELEELTEALETNDPKNIEQEFADLFIFLLSFAGKTGINVYDSVIEKMAFNQMRYLAKYFQEGDYSEARKKVKQEEKDLNLKDQFYNN